MRKSIIVLILSFFFINNIELVFPNVVLSYNDLNRQAIQQGEYFCKINIDIESLDDIDKSLKNVQGVLYDNGVHGELVEDDVLKDIYEENTAFIYHMQNKTGYHIIVDMRLNNVADKSRIYEEDKKADKIQQDIKDKIEEGIAKLTKTKNIKIRLDKEYSLNEGQHLVEQYLSKLRYEYKSQNIQNGYVIEVMPAINNNNKFVVSVAKYKDKVVIIYGEPYIYISY